jgi:ABC-2 type transport system permease protein
MSPPRSWIQYSAVVRKETFQTLRDKQVMFLLIVAPLIQTVLFGVAVDFDVDRVPTVVVDQDHSEASREHVRRLLADGTLVHAGTADNGPEAVRLLDDDQAKAALILPKGLGADLAAGRPAKVQVLIDGSDPIRAGVAGGAAGRYFGEATQAIMKDRLPPGFQTRPLEVVPRVLYNPSLKTRIFMVPGILAMLLVIVTTIVTAMGLSREREVGTLEQVMVTPIPPLMLLAGKMTPFVLIGLFDVLLALTAAMWVFDVPLRGSIPVLSVGTLFYLCSTLGVGLLVSTASSTQQQSFLGGFLFVLPASLLSGIMTPIRAMPEWLQVITLFNPLRWYAELVRGVLLRGADITDLWLQLVALFVFGTSILLLATARFKRRLA